MSKEMELELQLKEAQTAYGMLFDQKEAARTTVIANAFSEFVAPEGTRLSTRESSVEFDMLDGKYAYTLARLEISTDWSSDYKTRGYKATYRFSSGDNDQIKFLPAIAEFITIASLKADVICKLFLDIDNGFKDKMSEARKVRDDIQVELNEIDRARQQAKRDAILDLMKSDEGFVPIVAKPTDEYKWTKYTNLTMKWDWEISNPVLIKVVGQSASGKSVKVVVSRKNWDGSIYTYDVTTIRMDNLTRFIHQEVNLRDTVESKLEEFEITQGLLL